MKYKSIIPIEIHEIDQDGYHVFIHAMINDKRALLVLDTGASKSVFDINQCTEYGIEIEENSAQVNSTGIGNTSLESQLGIIHSIGIEEWQNNKLNIVLIDLQHVNNAYENIGKRKISGILGSDILYRYKAQINYAKSTLILKNPKKSRKNISCNH